jgi:hypothetical protein
MSSFVFLCILSSNQWCGSCQIFSATTSASTLGASASASGVSASSKKQMLLVALPLPDWLLVLLWLLKSGYAICNVIFDIIIKKEIIWT